MEPKLGQVNEKKKRKMNPVDDIKGIFDQRLLLVYHVSSSRFQKTTVLGTDKMESGDEQQAQVMTT